MNIAPAPEDQRAWNSFIAEHFPPVGAFMQTWEWGEFQKRLGRRVERYVVEDGGSRVAVFTLAHFSLPCGFSYAYAPRGPVFADPNDEERVAAVLQAIRSWARHHLPGSIFLRLEPPIKSFPRGLSPEEFRSPRFYVQPRFNAVVPLPQDGSAIEASFHPSTRSNIRRAEKRGVVANVTESLPPEERAGFSHMIADTIERNSGTNAYPGSAYFDAFFETIPFLDGTRDLEALSMAAFVGRQQGELASMHFVLFFAHTATYLYGASRTTFMSTKVDTYLHWAAMNEARTRDCTWYDLGGIDPQRWPSLTTFKRQFRGQEMEYAGDIDIPLRPRWYRIYSLLKFLGM